MPASSVVRLSVPGYPLTPFVARRLRGRQVALSGDLPNVSAAEVFRALFKGLDTAFCPEDAAHFALAATASIGPAGEDGAVLFQFEVCSPSWLAQGSLPMGFAFQRHTLLLERWDPRLLERAVRDLCRRTDDEGWAEIAGKLSRYGLWEFEDCRPA
jgi:hypothetical protein